METNKQTTVLQDLLKWVDTDLFCDSGELHKLKEKIEELLPKETKQMRDAYYKAYEETSRRGTVSFNDYLNENFQQ